MQRRLGGRSRGGRDGEDPSATPTRALHASPRERRPTGQGTGHTANHVWQVCRQRMRVSHRRSLDSASRSAPRSWPGVDWHYDIREDVGGTILQAGCTSDAVFTAGQKKIPSDAVFTAGRKKRCRRYDPPSRLHQRCCFHSWAKEDPQRRCFHSWATLQQFCKMIGLRDDDGRNDGSDSRLRICLL